MDYAQNAVDDLNGFELFDKQMNVDFAKTKSDATVKKDGDEAYEDHKRKRVAAMGMAYIMRYFEIR